MKKGLVAAVVAFPLFLLLLLVIPIMGGTEPSPGCSPTGGASVQVSGTAAAWGPYSAAQMSNAATIVEVGAQMSVPPRGQQIALMTAIDESGLQNLTGGDRDSVGLFQQRPSMGWGTIAQILVPTYAAQKFYTALLAVAGWETMSPATRAAHAVQANADPGVYQQYWDPAGAILAHLASSSQTNSTNQTNATGSTGSTSSPASVDAGAVAAAADSTSYCDTANTAGSDKGGSGFQVNGAVAYVGAYTPAQLLARAQQLSASGAIWYRMCEASVEVLAGRRGANYFSAASSMATAQAAGLFHSANSIDGHAPPIGAWLFYSNAGNPYGHVTTYLGDSQVESTDVWRQGHIDIGPASDITAGRWRLTYDGWAVPWATPATDVPIKPPQPATS